MNKPHACRAFPAITAVLRLSPSAIDLKKQIQNAPKYKLISIND